MTRATRDVVAIILATAFGACLVVATIGGVVLDAPRAAWEAIGGLLVAIGGGLVGYLVRGREVP